MMLHDFKCPRHGVFEASHAICPALGCDSDGVVKVFLKAPGVKSDNTKRFDSGMKKSADMYGQTDWKTAREGEMSKANNRAAELKWGDDAAAFLGAPIESSLPRGLADGVPALGLVQAEGASHQLAAAERTGVKKQDDKWRGELKSLVAPKP